MNEQMITSEHPKPALRALGEVAWLFFRLGCTAFGGPAAHIAMMREEFVRRRQWMSEERFADLIGVTNLIPGPSSTELAIYLGYLRAGWLGLLLAGICFIGPAGVVRPSLGRARLCFVALPQIDSLVFGSSPVL